MLNPSKNYPTIFLNTSTMITSGELVAKDLFLGGCVYVTGEHPMPWYVSRMLRVKKDNDIPDYVKACGKNVNNTICIWEISDTRGIVFASAVFSTTNSNKATIITIYGMPGGCIVGRTANNNNTTIRMLAGYIDTIPDLRELDNTGLVFDPCCCTTLKPRVTAAGEESTLSSIVLPSGYKIETDVNGLYYIRKTAGSTPSGYTPYLTRLSVVANGSTYNLTGENVTITPGPNTVEVNGKDNGMPGGDIRIFVKDNIIVIGNRSGINSIY